MAILMGSTGVNDKVAQARGFRQLPQASCASPGLRNQYLCPVAHSELITVPQSLHGSWEEMGRPLRRGWIKAGGWDKQNGLDRAEDVVV